MTGRAGPWVIALGVLLAACAPATPTAAPIVTAGPLPGPTAAPTLISDARIQEIDREVKTVAAGHLQSTYANAGYLEVSLLADSVALAETIGLRYGDAVRVTVGRFPHPMPSPLPPSVCSFDFGQPFDPAPLRATLTLASGTVRSGGDFRGTIRVTNVGSEPYDFDSGDMQIGAVLEPGALEVVGVYTGVDIGGPLEELLAPADSVEQQLLGGTASCDPAVGYAVPPGSYDVRAIIERSRRGLDGATRTEYFLSEPATITVTP